MYKIEIAFLLLFIFVSCQKDPEPIFELSVPTLKCDAAGGHQVISVTSNLDWNVETSGEDWISTDQNSGSKNGKITVTISENKSIEPRMTVLKIKAQNLTQLVSISQTGALALLTIDKTIQNIESSNGSFTLGVTTNGANWSTSGVPAWISLTPASGSASGNISVGYQANTLAASRNATITFTSGSSSKTLTIIQAPASATLSLDKTNENVNSTAGNFTLDVTTNGANWSTSGVPAWISLIPANGSVSGNISVSYQANTLASPRSASITFTSGSSSKVLTVNQAAASASISLDKTSENVNSAAGSFAVEVTTNGASWTTSGVPNWITINPANGSTSGQVTISYQANNLAVSRTATITFTSGTSSKSLVITQTEATPVLQINISKKQVGYQAGSLLVELTTNNAEWKITGLPAWMSANPLQGDKSGTVTLSYQANTLKEKRSAQIVFSAGNISQTLFFEQLTPVDANDGGNW
jgi:hypothetical protein